MNNPKFKSILLPMLSRFLIFILISVAGNCAAQPFVDIATFQHISLENSGASGKKTNATTEGSWDLAMLNLPFKIDSTHLLVFSPGYEYRSEINDEQLPDAYYHTLYFPLTYLHTFKGSKNQASLTGIYRYNTDTRNDFGSKNDQYGILGIFYHRQNENLSYKMGLYVNEEFFHTQYIPFVGIDYHISKRLTLFSLLPRYLVLDYTLSPALHTGFWYRGIDESYRLLTNVKGDYYRVKEIYLRAYADYYIPHTRLVFTLAAGHTVSRQYSYREAGTIYKIYPEGAFVLQAGLAFRFVTDPLFRTQRAALP